MTLEGKPFRFQLGVGVLIFIGLMIVGYIFALFDWARVNDSITTTMVLWTVGSGAMAVAFVGPYVPLRVRRAWIHLKYATWATVLTALVALALLYPPDDLPTPFGLAELVVGIGFAVVILVPLLVSEWKEELTWWTAVLTSPEITESSVDRTLAVFQRKLEQPKQSSGPQKPSVLRRRDHKTVGTGGSQIFSSQPRRW